MNYPSLPLGKKNNTFQFYEDKKHIKNFAGTDFELFNIYNYEKDFLAYN